MPHAAARRALIRLAAAFAALALLPAHGIYKWVNEKGERVYLEDKDRAAEAAGWRKEIEAYCD